MRPMLVRDVAIARRIDRIITTYLEGLRDEDRELDQVKSITALARQGIGFHHAGLLPLLKQLVEVLFTHGLMQVVFATDTLALGVNMPARTVVIGRLSKWDGRRRRPLIPNEFQQMAGRAGRRGMDAKGDIVVPHSPWISFKETLEIATGELEPVRSSFAIRYNTVLNLWDPPHGSRVKHMLQQSLFQFQTSRRVRDFEDAALSIGGDIEAIPQGCLIGLDAGDELLDEYRGINASVTTLRGRERRLLRDLRDLRLQFEDRPWPEPGRQALRRVFKFVEPGTPVHLRDKGWAIYVGRGNQGGVGLFLTSDSIDLIAEYRQIDYLPAPVRHLKLPDELLQVQTPIDDPVAIATRDSLDRVWADLRALELPDLDALAETRRREVEARIGNERSSIERELTTVRDQLRMFTESRIVHPCHICARRKEHQNNLKRVSVLERERDLVQASLGKEISSEEERIRHLIRGIRDVLHRFGYLHRGYPTAKADSLANVFDTNGLLMCEVIDRGFLDRLTPATVAEVFSWFAYDRDFRFGNSFTLPNRLVLLRRRLDDLEQEVFAAERSNGLFISTGHSDGFYGPMNAWCEGSSISQILEKIELSEGDLVLTFNKTIDIMRQLRDMLGQAMPDHPLRATLEEAERLVRRDIVEQSLTIGFLPLIQESDIAKLNDRSESASVSPEPYSNLH
jgi:ATP-dependent RNA helicase HelY